MKTVETAKVFVLNPEMELLVVRRCDDPSLETYRPGELDLPGGELDYKETPEMAAAREMREECGAYISSLSLTWLATRENPSKYGHKNIRHFFIAETDLTDPPIEVGAGQGKEALWSSVPYAVRNLGHPVQRSLLATMFGMSRDLIVSPVLA